MGLDPNLVLYSCVAKETMILAEFNSKDHPDLGSLALKCLDKTPPFHSNFSHTIRGKSYTFLIHNPFTYFAIFDEKLQALDGLAFLELIKKAFDDVGNGCWSKRKLDSLGSHCFQGEFNPVFHQVLVVSSGTAMGMQVPEWNRSVGSGRGGHGMMIMNKTTKKRFLNELFWIGKGRDGGGERKVDVWDEDDDDDDDDDDDESRLKYTMQKKNGNNGSVSGSVEPFNHAKKSWQKHVWIVLSFDLIICLILFSVWLWVCRGFKCIDG